MFLQENVLRAIYTGQSWDTNSYAQSRKYCNDSLHCQKLPFLFSSEVYCFVMFNCFTLKISGFNLNLSVKSFLLPLLFFCSIIFSQHYFFLFASCYNVLQFFFLYDNNNSLLPKGILRLNSLICMRGSNYSDKHHWGCMCACVYISLQKHTSTHIYLKWYIYC